MGSEAEVCEFDSVTHQLNGFGYTAYFTDASMSSSVE